MIEMGALVPQVSGNRLVKIYTERLLKRPDALNLFSYDDPEGTGRQREAGVAWLQNQAFLPIRTMFCWQQAARTH